jgi:tetratricopeptide (TPR) repeat protein
LHQNPLGNLLAKQSGRETEAEELLRSQGQSGDGAAWFNLGMLLSQQAARTVDAEDAYRQAIAVGLTYALNNLGILLARVGRDAEAELTFRGAIAAGHVAAYRNLGVLLEGLPGRLKEAAEAYRDGALAGDAEAELSLQRLLYAGRSS